VAEVVSGLVRVPVSRLLEGEIEKLLHMEDRSTSAWWARTRRPTVVANAVRRSRPGSRTPTGRSAASIFPGPHRRGQDRLARALAEFLFDGRERHDPHPT